MKLDLDLAVRELLKGVDFHARSRLVVDHFQVFKFACAAFVCFSLVFGRWWNREPQIRGSSFPLKLKLEPNWRATLLCFHFSRYPFELSFAVIFSCLMRPISSLYAEYNFVSETWLHQKFVLSPVQWFALTKYYCLVFRPKYKRRDISWLMK